MSTIIVVTLLLLNAALLATTSPRCTVLYELLDPRPQRRLVQVEIVHGADTHDFLSREAGADAVHQRAAVGAEVVLHRVACGDGAGLLEGFEYIGAADVFDRLVGDDEVGRVGGGGDFAAVGAVAHKGVDETTRLLSGLWRGGQLNPEIRLVGNTKKLVDQGDRENLRTRAGRRRSSMLLSRGRCQT